MNVKKVLLAAVTVALILAVIFAAGCTSPEQQNAPTTPVSTPVATTNHQLDGYTVTTTINSDTPLDSRLVTETALVDALNKIEANVAARLGGLDTSTLQFDTSDYGKYLKVGKDGKITLGNISSGSSSHSTYVTNNAVWGSITGDITKQTDLQTELSNMLDMRDFEDYPENSFIMVNPSSSNSRFGATPTIPASQVVVEEGGDPMPSTSIPIATTTERGGVIPDGTTITVDSEGKISATGTGSVSFTNITGQPTDNTNLAAALAGKVNTETGKGLSTNDYTTDEKTKLGSLATIKSVGTGLNLDSSTGTLTASSSAPAWNDILSKPFNTIGGGLTVDSTELKVDTTSIATKDELAGKVDKVEGKGLSTNDYTNDEKTKLGSLATIKSISTGLNLSEEGILTAISSAPTWESITGKPTFGTASTKNSTNAVTSGSTDIVESGAVYTALAGKQDTLVSGTSIKTINSESLLGSGNIVITGEENVQSDWNEIDTTKDSYIQNKPTIVSDVTIDGGSSLVTTGIATIPKGSNSALGVVKVDGTTITADANGVISTTGTPAGHASTHNIGGSDAIDTASSTTNGLLSSTDWNTFNNKQSQISAGTAGQVLTYTGTAGSVGSLAVDTSVGTGTNLVTNGAVKTALDTKQDKANITTTVAASASASDEKYPSEKAVRTELDTKQNSISSTNKISADNVENGTTNKFNVQSDWNQTTTTADDYIKNKPHLYQHNIVLYSKSGDNITSSIGFSFINNVESAYTSEADICKALYDCGYRGTDTFLAASGFDVNNYQVTYLGIYCNNRDNVNTKYLRLDTYNKTIGWASNGWANVKDHVNTLL